MGVIKTKGIVIAEHVMGDYDKMLTILTDNYGKIGCAAKGARKQKSSMMPVSQFLCFCDFVIYKGATSYNLNSGEIIESFYNLKTDFENLEIVTYITKIIKDVTDENQNTAEILKLFLNTLYMLSKEDKDTSLILSIFRLRLIKLIGFTPRVQECVDCKTKENLKYFSFKENGLKCTSCIGTDKSAINISDTTLYALRYILYSEAKKIFSFTISEEAKKELEIISTIYLNNKLEKEYKI